MSNEQYIETDLEAEGMMVVTEAEHLCEAMRGIETPSTTTAQGIFEDPSQTPNPRDRLFRMIDRGDE